MRLLIVFLLCCATSFAQDVRQIYGTSSSVGGAVTVDNLRSRVIVGQSIVGEASGGAFGSGSGFGSAVRAADILLIAPENPDLLPEAFDFPQNYPNPFNPSTTLEFSLPRDSQVRLIIFDILGREVSTLVDASLPAGRYVHRFQSPGNLASGLYFAVFTAGDYHKVRKLMLLK
jgi:hypothetical protein